MRRAPQCRPRAPPSSLRSPCFSPSRATSTRTYATTPKVTSASTPPSASPAPLTSASLQELLQNREWPVREKTWERSQRFARATRLVLGQIFQSENVTGLAIASMVICGIGCAEGALLLHFPLHHPGLVFRYGLENVLASISRGTVPMDLLIHTVGEKKVILKDLAAPGAESLVLQVNHLKSARSLIAGFVGFAQIFRCVNILLDGPKGWREKEPLFGRVKGRVIRLAGLESDCTAWDLGGGNDHIVPVFDDPAAVEPLIRRASRNLARPIYWQAKISEYGRASTWDRLKISRDWLIPIEGSKSRGLFLEADASVSNQSFSLSLGAFEEIGLASCSEAFRLLARRAEACGALEPGDKVIRVILADGTTPITTGGGFSESLRARIDRMRDVDILIDSTRTLQRSILDWLGKATTGLGGKKVVVVDAEAARDFQSLSALLRNEGYDVLDCEDPSVTPSMPRVVYHPTTTRTVCAVARLLSNKRADPMLTLALLDRHEGIAEIDDLAKQNNVTTLPHLCAATIYADRFKAVRMLIRKGLSIAEVQAAVDKL